MSVILRAVVVTLFAVPFAMASPQDVDLNDLIDENPAPAQVPLPLDDSEYDLQSLADAEDSFGSFVRSRSVILDAANGIDGAIGTLNRETGNLNPSSTLNVELYDDKSRRIKSIVTDVNGRFRFSDLSGGMYQLVAKGRNGFLAFSLMVIERGSIPADDLGQRTESLFLVQAPMNTREAIEVISAAVPPTFNEVNSILRLHYGLTLPTYMLPNTSSPNVVNSDPAPETSDVPGPDSLIAREAVRTYEVPLLEGNRIRGRVYALDPETGEPIKVARVYVHIIRNDQAVGPPIPVNNRGEFEAELVDGPGAYSIVVAGKDGFGAAGFYARPRKEMEAEYQPDRAFFVNTELTEVEIVDPRIGPGGQRFPPIAKPRNMLTLALVTNDVLKSQMPAIGKGAGVVEPDEEFSSIRLGSAVVDGGFASGGVTGSRGGRGVGALLLGGGVAAAIAISADDNDRRQASPYAP